MQNISFQEALRFLFSPFVAVAFLMLLDVELAQRLLALIPHHVVAGTIAATALLVAGSLFYFVYRFVIYDYLIVWLHDILRNENARIFLWTHYQFPHPKHSLRSSILACKILAQVSNLAAQYDNAYIRTFASGIHFLYQATILTIPCAIYALSVGAYGKAAVFMVGGVILSLAAVLADIKFEDEELAQIRDSNLKAAVDQAARRLGVEPRSVVL